MPQIRVRAVGDRLHPDVNGIPGRFTARNLDRSAIAEGVLVDDHSDHRRAIADGDLELVADRPAATTATAATAVSRKENV